jgi:hypothetical protein
MKTATPNTQSGADGKVLLGLTNFIQLTDEYCYAVNLCWGQRMRHSAAHLVEGSYNFNLKFSFSILELAKSTRMLAFLEIISHLYPSCSPGFFKNLSTSRLDTRGNFLADV